MQQILLNDGYYLHQPNNPGYWYLCHFNSEPYLFFAFGNVVLIEVFVVTELFTTFPKIIQLIFS